MKETILNIKSPIGSIVIKSSTTGTVHQISAFDSSKKIYIDKILTSEEITMLSDCLNTYVRQLSLK